MREARKTPNIHIRQSSRHSNRGESIKLKPLPQFNGERKKASSNKPEAIASIRKDLLELENLTEEQQARIRRQAQRAATKKVKVLQTKLESDIISMLEGECSKLGMEVEKQKAENRQLRFEIGELRKNIDFLGRKIQHMSNDKQTITKNIDFQQIQKAQLQQQLALLRKTYQQVYSEKENQSQSFHNQIKQLKEQLSGYKHTSQSYEVKLETALSQKSKLEEELAQKIRDCENLRQTLQREKREWDQKQLQFESQAKENMDKKGEKIYKFQTQIQLLSQKLKEEEGIRKKMVDKNQELQRQIARKSEISNDLEDQIAGLKKRLNDLSILKSSNATIMNQKLQQLTEENAKLKRNYELFKKRGVVVEEQSNKPFLFGPEEAD